MAMPSRIGTAPFEAGPQEEHPLLDRQPDRQRDEAAEHRPDHERQQGREREPVRPGGLAGELGQPHGQPEHDERDDLGQAGERGVEPGDLPLVGAGSSPIMMPATRTAGNPRPLGDGGHAEDDEHAR